MKYISILALASAACFRLGERLPFPSTFYLLGQSDGWSLRIRNA